MPDFRAAYSDARERITAIVPGLDDGTLAKKVPACPLWSVKDLLAHLVFIASESTVSGGGPIRFDGDVPDDILRVLASEDRAAVDSWTQRGVDERSDRTVPELLEEWRAHSELLCAQLAGGRPWPEGLVPLVHSYTCVGDIAAHYQDLRGALGLGADREPYASKLAYASRIFQFEGPALAADVVPVTIVTERGEHRIGRSEGGSTIEMDWFELWRVLDGRRSAAQIAKLFGDVNAGPYIPILHPDPPTTALEV